jgi:hypothetical protein
MIQLQYEYLSFYIQVNGVSLIKDRIYYGFLAGLSASIFRFIYGWGITFILLPFGYKITRWHDFSGVLLYGFIPILWYEIAIAEIAVIMIEGVLGIGFAYLIKYTTSSHYVFKAWLYSMAFWFSSFAITSLFQSPGLQVISGISTLVNAISASIYGLALAFTSKRIVSEH